MAFGMRPHHSPATTLKHSPISSDKKAETEKYLVFTSKSFPFEQFLQLKQKHSLIADVIKAPLVHVHALNADEVLLAVRQASAVLKGSVVYHNPLS